MTTTAGSNAGTDNTQVNGLQLRYDSSLDDSTVRARLIGPFDQFNSGSRQGGIMFGTNQDNYVKLAVTNKNGVPKLELFSEVGGTGTSVSTVTLPNPATLQTLDLYLIPDPATRHVRAAYRAVGPGGDTGIVPAAHRCGHPDRAAGPILRAQRRRGDHHEPQGVDPDDRDVRLLLRDAG